VQDKTGNSVFYVYDDLHHSTNESSSFITNSLGRADQHDLCRSIFYLFLQNSDCSKNNCKIRIGIQYLPFGEPKQLLLLSSRTPFKIKSSCEQLFVSQKNSSFDTRYKFTAPRYRTIVSCGTNRKFLALNKNN